MKNNKIIDIIKNGILEFFEEVLDYYGTPNDNAEYVASFMYDDNNGLTEQGNQVVKYWENVLNKNYNDEQINNLHKNLESDVFYEFLPDVVAKILNERKEMKKDNQEFSEVQNIGYEILCELGVEHYGLRSFKNKVKEAKESNSPATFNSQNNSEPTR